jgi:ABC-type polar amino acid transport system ATPase subunit
MVLAERRLDCNASVRRYGDCTTPVKRAKRSLFSSGSGKSALIKCLNGFEAFQRGEIVGTVFQEF